MIYVKKSLKDLITAGITEKTTKTGTINSYSTNCFLCETCNARAAVDEPLNICRYCYARKLLNLRHTLYAKTARNNEIATGRAWTAADIPIIFARFFRLESFGEIQNETQVKNYFLLAKQNAGTIFNLFTKNADIIKNADLKKPENMRIVYSLQEINAGITPEKLEGIKKEFPFINSVFRVVTPEKLEGIKNQCGGFCPDCMKCFKAGPLQVITEGLRK